MLHNIPGLPQTLELALLQQRLAILSMQLGGERFMQQFLLPPYTTKLPSGEPAMIQPQAGVPQHLGSYAPPVGSIILSCLSVIVRPKHLLLWLVAVGSKSLPGDT